MKTLKILSAVALAAAFFFPLNASRANAYDLQHARAQKDLTPALQQSLQDKLSDVSGPYFDEQDEKKAKGQVYIDLLQKFEYLPTYGPHNHLVVSCKLGGVEYDPVKPGTAKGLATGKLKYLVFTYALESGQWVSVCEAQVGNAEPRRRRRQADEREPRARRAAQSRDGKNRANPRRCGSSSRSRSESSRPRRPVKRFLSLVHASVSILTSPCPRRGRRKPRSGVAGRGTTPTVHPLRLVFSRFRDRTPAARQQQNDACCVCQRCTSPVAHLRLAPTSPRKRRG